MSLVNAKGVVISCSDAGEKDKLVSVYTLEYGIISAKLIGVKKADAKMKFVQPFCFADFIFNISNNSKIITSADVIDRFYDIVENLDAYFAASEAAGIVKMVCPDGQKDEFLFVELLKALKCFSYEKFLPEMILIKFYLSLFERMGYKLHSKKCPACGGEFLNKRYINFLHGEIVCGSCKTLNMKEISVLAHTAMLMLSGCSYEKLGTIKLQEKALKEALLILRENLKTRL